MSIRLDNGLLEYPHLEDSYVLLVSRRVRCTEEQLDRVMGAYISRHREEDGDPRRLDEAELAVDLSRELGKPVWVSAWLNPAGMMEYYVELEGQSVDWEWLAK
jgi:hypothetical protein